MLKQGRFLDLVADRRAPWAVVAALSIVGPLQNVYLSGFTGEPGPLWKVWIYETSSGVVLIALGILVAWSAARFPIRKPTVKSVATHVLVSIVFSAIHVASMVAIRKVVFELLGDQYNFGAPLRGFAYEYGKDAFTYAAFLTAFSVSQWVRESAARRIEAEGFRARGGVTVKTTRGALFVPFAAIVHVESSGNYVTLYTASGEFLHRATMKELEQVLAPGEFARTHRSHLVRLAAVRSVRSGTDGEKVLELQDGRRVPLSRTYAVARDWTLPINSPPTANVPRVS